MPCIIFGYLPCSRIASFVELLFLFRSVRETWVVENYEWKSENKVPYFIATK
jgi:hypothetical protein